MLDVCAIETPEAATAALSPLRNRLLAELDEPDSAAGLAARLDIPRQKVNYHLRELERLGLVSVAEERRWGGLTERRVVANASSFVISPAALGRIASDPDRVPDRLSAGYLVALGARVVREVSDLVRRAAKADKRLATLSMDATVRFRSAKERAAFTRELTDAVTQLVGKYHDPNAPGGRPHRLLVAAHPLPTTTQKDPTSCQ
ncbi:MAG: ArsR/SmtB family transcription factor [Planctomycetota bacterium]|jgi:DNA-binding transcriptional ArsR family regulator